MRESEKELRDEFDDWALDYESQPDSTTANYQDWLEIQVDLARWDRDKYQKRLKLIEKTIDDYRLGLLTKGSSRSSIGTLANIIEILEGEKDA